MSLPPRVLARKTRSSISNSIFSQTRGNHGTNHLSTNHLIKENISRITLTRYSMNFYVKFVIEDWGKSLWCLGWHHWQPLITNLPLWHRWKHKYSRCDHNSPWHHSSNLPNAFSPPLRLMEKGNSPWTPASPTDLWPALNPRFYLTR